MLPVGPWAAAAVLLVLLVGLSVPVPTRRDELVSTAGSWLTGRRAAPVALATVTGLLLASRVAGDDELDNPVPALVVGVLWPALLVLPALAAPFPRLRTERVVGGAGDVRPAVAAALAVVGYLTLAPRPTLPATLGTALAGYALVLTAVGVALGRGVAARTELVGLLSRWAALGPALVSWRPPRGAAAVLAVVLGGAWAERTQRGAAWLGAEQGQAAQVALLGLSLAVAAGLAVLLTGCTDGKAAPVLLPLAAGAVLGGVLRRAVISVQLLWDQLGAGSPGVVADPLGVAGGQGAVLGAVTLGGALAAAVLARRTGPGAARLSGLGLVLVATATSAVVVLQP